MPRNRRLRSIANLLRVLGLAAAITALATAVIWRWAPGVVAVGERTLTAWLLEPLARAWQEARNSSEPEERRSRFAKLLGRLQTTERDDRHAEVVRACHTELANLALARDDHVAATAWLRAAYAFDDRDLHTATRLAEQLCSVPRTAAEGIALLRTTTARFPSNPIVVPALARELIARDDCRAALAVFLKAAAQPQSNLWSIAWHGDPHGERTDLVPTLQAGRLRLQFTIAEAVTGLRVLAPLHRDLLGVEAHFRVTGGRTNERREVAGTVTANPRRDKGRTSFDLDVSEFAGNGIDVLFEVDDAPYIAAALAAPAGDPRIAAFAATLQSDEDAASLAALCSWRLAALPALFALAHRESDNDEFRRTRQITFRPSTTDPRTFVATAQLDHPIAAVRITLPLDAGYRLEHLVWIAADGSEVATALGATGMIVLGPPGVTAVAVRITGQLY